jgi:DNA repair protein RadA/Sms
MIFTCTKCDAQFPKWQGRCDQCGKWGTLEEGGTIPVKESKQKMVPDKTTFLTDIKIDQEHRIKTNISELDRVLGSGIVPGSITLLGGDPGVGKSTLTLQIADQVKNTLYISGEESGKQVKMRAQRLDIKEKISFLFQTNIEKIIATISKNKPALVIIDSIQTMSSTEASGGLGSVSQITACAGKLMTTAKNLSIPIIIIGHITKEGIVAGPKTLEHLVDAVLYLENDNKNFYKILRGVKNRFGSIGEIGIFEMTSSGLTEIKNSTNIFLDSDSDNDPGSVYSVIFEGSRPFLIEVQALVNKTNFGYPIRKATGFDTNRLQMIIAVITKHTNHNLENQDIYLNITGGLKINDPAVDLAVAASIISAFTDSPKKKSIAAIGELGLSGEIRTVPKINDRLKELKRFGFNNIISPAHELKNIKNIKI